MTWNMASTVRQVNVRTIESSFSTISSLANLMLTSNVFLIFVCFACFLHFASVTFILQESGWSVGQCLLKHKDTLSKACIDFIDLQSAWIYSPRKK